MSASRKTGNFLARKKGRSEERSEGESKGGRWRDMERREREGVRGKEGGRKPKSIQSQQNSQTLTITDYSELHDHRGEEKSYPLKIPLIIFTKQTHRGRISTPHLQTT